MQIGMSRLSSLCQFDDSGDMQMLDNSAATPASLSRVWFIVLAKSLFYKYVRPQKEDESRPAEENGDDGEDSSDAPGSGYSTPSGSQASKVGGRRRKGGRRR
jgi:hypothetical protein